MAKGGELMTSWFVYTRYYYGIDHSWIDHAFPS